MVLSFVRNLSGDDKSAKNVSYIDNDKPLFRKLSKKGSSSSTKASLRTIKQLGTRFSPRNMMRDALERSKKILRNEDGQIRWGLM